MTKQIYLGLLGEPGSGKDTVAKILKEKYKAKILTSSYLLKKSLSIFLDSISREDYIWFVKELTKKYGEDIISKAMIKNMKEYSHRVVVFNGVRLPSDFEYLKKEGGILIYITAKSKLRWKRVTKRGEKSDDGAPYEKFLEMHKAKTEKEVPEMGKKADHTISNDGTLEDLENNVTKVISAIL